MAAGLAAHQGHADPLGFLLGLASLWVFLRVGVGHRDGRLIFGPTYFRRNLR